MRKLSNKESGWIRFQLSRVNPLFAEMWKRFEPMVFDENAESAELEIHNNNFRIVANPIFWKSCDDIKRLFVICHEMCHVMFGHWLINPKLDREWCNIAQDIQVNEFLANSWFGKKVMSGDDFVTLESVFKHKSKLVKKNQNYLYYYDLLIRCLRTTVRD